VFDFLFFLCGLFEIANPFAQSLADLGKLIGTKDDKDDDQNDDQLCHSNSTEHLFLLTSSSAKWLEKARSMNVSIEDGIVSAVQDVIGVPIENSALMV
jgi:hypothetical protein